MPTHLRRRRSSLGFACVLSLSLGVPLPVRGTVSPLLERPDAGASKRGLDLLGAGDRKLAADDKVGAAVAYTAAADEFLAAADALRGVTGDLLDIRSDHVISALRLQLQAHAAVPLSRDQLRQIHERTTATLAELKELHTDDSSLETIHELLAQLPTDSPVLESASVPEAPAKDGALATPTKDGTPASPPRATRGLTVGLGVSAGVLGLSTIILATGYTSMERLYDDAQGVAKLKMNDQGIALKDDDDLCSGPLRDELDHELDDLCRKHGHWQSVTIAGSVGLGVSAAATVVFAVLLARARRSSSARPTATAVTPLRGGAMLGATWQF